MSESLDQVNIALRETMLRSRGEMHVATDVPGNLVLKTPWLEPGKKEAAWFGAIQLKKNYVSCHLMPLYALPTLADDLSPEPRKRMQGKSCFNFKKVEPELFEDLEHLIAKCATAYLAPVVARPHSG